MHLTVGIIGGVLLVFLTVIFTFLFIDLNPSSHVPFASPQTKAPIFKLSKNPPIFFMLSNSQLYFDSNFIYFIIQNNSKKNSFEMSASSVQFSWPKRVKWETLSRNLNHRDVCHFILEIHFKPTIQLRLTIIWIHTRSQCPMGECR